MADEITGEDLSFQITHSKFGVQKSVKPLSEPFRVSQEGLQPKYGLEQKAPQRSTTPTTSGEEPEGQFLSENTRRRWTNLPSQPGDKSIIQNETHPKPYKSPFRKFSGKINQ